jgi:hypothetical protein
MNCDLKISMNWYRSWKELSASWRLLGLLNQEWQVGPGEREIRCRDAVMPDVGGNVFVVRVRAGQ